MAAGASRLPNDAGLIDKIVGLETQQVRRKGGRVLVAVPPPNRRSSGTTSLRLELKQRQPVVRSTPES